MIGSVTVKVAPWPSPGLLARMLPPCISTSCLTMASPSPRPPCRRVVLASAWRKRSKTCGRNSGLMPMPVSMTLISTCELTRSRSTWTWPPLGVNLTALESRFQTTCWSRAASPVTGAGERIEHLMDADALGVGCRQHGGEGGLDDLGKVQPLDVEAEVAGDDAGDVEQVVDELGLGLRIPLDGREPLLQVLGVDLAGAEDLGPAEDGVERRAQLVRERGQEFVLHAVGRLGLGPAASAAASSRSRSSSARLRSVMSLATFEAPMILPSASRIGETLSETSMMRPSFVRRLVSKWSTRSPLSDALQDPGRCPRQCSGGIRMEMCLPMISSAA